jgi:SAM-dependent methyltransferase
LTGTADLLAIKRRQQQAWASGDYGQIGARILITSELLCEAVDARPGHKVLDVATGTGNAALAAARRWCDVTGVDYVPALLERARRRAEAEGLPVTFQEGDAEDLPFRDGSFDVVLSAFGVMFAPDQEQAARELLRVCRPGGKIGLASWTPDGFTGELLRAVAPYAPPRPCGVKPPLLWGTEDRLHELLGDGAASVRTARRSITFRYRSPEHFVGFFRANDGPIIEAFERLNATRREDLAGDIEDLVRRFNRADDGTMVWPLDYLEVLAVRR